MRIFSRYRHTNDNQDEIVTFQRYDMDTVPSIPDAESFVSSCWLLRDDFLPRPGSSLFLVVVFPISLLIYRCSSENAVDSWFELLHKLAGNSYASPSFIFHFFGIVEHFWLKCWSSFIFHVTSFKFLVKIFFILSLFRCMLWAHIMLSHYYSHFRS